MTKFTSPRTRSRTGGIVARQAMAVFLAVTITSAGVMPLFEIAAKVSA